jgi:dolichol kinase
MNYRRNLVHMGFGVFAVLLVVATPQSWLLPIAAGWTLLAWTLESTRRVWPRWNDWLMETVFKGISHPHERNHVNSATWYASALTILAAAASLPTIVVGLAVLGFGDPMAAIVGRRWGRIRLLHGRSLEGSAAFLVVGTLAATIGLAAIGFEAGPATLFAVALGGAAAGTIGELLSLRVDDNFSVPLASAGGAAAVMYLLGLPF